MDEQKETKPIDSEAFRIARKAHAQGWLEAKAGETAADTEEILKIAKEIEDYSKEGINEEAFVQSWGETASPGPFGGLHLERGTFGQAVEALKAGKMVSRKGWNGKGMYLLMIESGKWGLGTVYEQINKDTDGFLPWIGMKTADNKFVPWLASQTDILATDWGLPKL